MICVPMRKNRGTELGNFAFKTFGKFLKLDLVSAAAAAQLPRPTGLTGHYAK